MTDTITHLSLPKTLRQPSFGWRAIDKNAAELQRGLPIVWRSHQSDGDSVRRVKSNAVLKKYSLSQALSRRRPTPCEGDNTVSIRETGKNGSNEERLVTLHSSGLEQSGRLKSSAAGGLAVTVALLAWLWPIGIGGKMPIGGDVTNFFLGLMAVLGESLREGRLPVWNDLWGYGFPGLAESQMGVFYPPHVILYKFLATETAYVASLVLHTLWGGLGAFWAARKLGISSAGSALAAFSWSACGFFMVHLAHPWGYTTGCWMPWAWGVAWSILAPGSTARTAASLLLSLVLVLQVLPGHFQLAFLTQFTVGLDAGLGGRRVMAWTTAWWIFREWRARSVLTGEARAEFSWLLPRCSRLQPCNFGRPRDWRGWRKVSSTSSTCPGSRRLRSTWSTMSHRDCSIVRSYGGRWSGIRLIHRPRSISPTSD